MDRPATSTSVAAPHRLVEIWVIQQPGSLQIKRVYGAIDPIQVCRPVLSLVSCLSIPTGSEKTTQSFSCGSLSNKILLFVLFLLVSEISHITMCFNHLRLNTQCKVGVKQVGWRVIHYNKGVKWINCCYDSFHSKQMNCFVRPTPR